jgi:hypothetical protein
VFEGLRPAAAGLLAATGWSVIKPSLFREAAGGSLSFKPVECLIMLALYILWTKFEKLPVILFIAGGAAAGIILKL